MKKVRFFLLFLIVVLVASCAKDEMTDPGDQYGSDALKSAMPKLKIAVVSDLHYMDPSLLPENPEAPGPYQDYLNQDPKLLTLSAPILRQVIDELKSQKPDVVLVPGDMTKDGEAVSHESVVELLGELTAEGIKVFVVPGNHDINNPEAWDYKKSEKAETLDNAEGFEEMYAAFGYGNAFSTDENSLSYVSAVNEKLWVLGIDACKYAENEEIAIVGGAIKPETMVWMQGIMAEANSNGIQVLAMMHHGILQHYYGQEQIDAGYLVDNWPEMAAAFMGMGIKIVFTGHYHANDISLAHKGLYSLYDIQTGSLVTAPCPYRMITIDENFMNIKSRHVTTLPIDIGVDFVTYSNMFLSGHLDFYFEYALKNVYYLDEQTAKYIAPYLRNGIMAHYAGDEKINPEEKKGVKEIERLSPEFGKILNSFWDDLPITDNEAQIKIK